MPEGSRFGYAGWYVTTVPAPFESNTSELVTLLLFRVSWMLPGSTDVCRFAIVKEML